MYGLMGGIRPANSRGSSSFVNNSLTEWAISARNANTVSSRALRLRNAEDTADTLAMVRSLTYGEDILVVGYSADSVASGAVSLCRSFTYKSLDDGQLGYSMAKFEIDATSSGDYGAIGAVIRQNASGAAAIRALEGHATRLSPATANFTWGAEIGCHVNVAGDTLLQNLGIFLYSDDTFIGTTGVMADAGLWVGGDQGFHHPIRVIAKDSTTVLFDVAQGASQTGTVTSGNLLPRGDVTYSIGGGGARWLTAYSTFFLAGAGSFVGPTLTFSANTGAGFSAAAANVMVVSTNSLGRSSWDASGNFEHGPHNAATGVSEALATNATDGHLYIPTCAGTPTGAAGAFTGRAPFVVDTSGSKIWFRVGGTWKGVVIA